MRLLGKKFAFIVIAAAVLATVLLVLWRVGADVGSLIGLTLFAMMPLTLAAAGECLNQKAGLINVGIEGMLLIGAFIGAFMAGRMEHWGLGILWGILAGAAMGVLFGAVGVYGRGNQIIAGLGINIFGMGLTAFLMFEWALARVLVLPTEFQVPRWVVPGVGSISPLLFVTLAVAVAAHYILHRTLLGIRIRAAGEKPEADDVAGVRVNRIRMLTAVLGGALAGLAGATMTVGWFGKVPKEVSGGRGFIALAIVIFAGAEPLWALFGAFLFGFTDAFALWMDISPEIRGLLPPHADNFFKMIPFIVPILALAFVKRARGPSALGKPYIRE